MSLADTLSSVTVALAPKEEVKVTYRDGLPDYIDVPSAPEASTQAEFNTIMADLGVGSSRVDLQACKLEYSIVSPK